MDTSFHSCLLSYHWPSAQPSSGSFPSGKLTALGSSGFCASALTQRPSGGQSDPLTFDPCPGMRISYHGLAKPNRVPPHSCNCPDNSKQVQNEIKRMSVGDSCRGPLTSTLLALQQCAACLLSKKINMEGWEDQCLLHQR